MAKNRPPPEPLTRERVIEALRKAGGAAQKRDIARELDIGPDQKKELRHILRALEEDGALGRTGKKRYADAQALPESGVMEIVDRDADGELLARMRGPDGLFGPHVRLAPGEARGTKNEAAVGIGDRVLARIAQTPDGPEARVTKRLGQSAHRILGVYRVAKDHPREQGAPDRGEIEQQHRPDNLGVQHGNGVTNEAEGRDHALELKIKTSPCDAAPAERQNGKDNKKGSAIECEVSPEVGYSRFFELAQRNPEQSPYEARISAGELGPRFFAQSIQIFFSAERMNTARIAPVREEELCCVPVLRRTKSPGL